MNLSMHNQALLRGILAGAVVLSGASGCSRSDRAGGGRDTTETGATAVTPSDTQTGASATQPSAGAATQPSGDTAMTTTRDTARATAQALTSRQPSTPSNRRVRPDTMERDSSVQPDPSAETAGTGAASPLDSAGVTSDYALTADTSAAGYSEMAADTTGSSEMARDTSSAAGRGDTAAVAVTDTTAQAESDTANIQVQIDTTTAQAQADTTPVVHTDTVTVATADSADTASATREPAAAQAANADTLQDHAGRIRPPEDSTEIRGNVTTNKDRAEARSNAVTGIDAVALMSRAGARCVVKDDSSDVWWDMADSPAALNPCGTGAMTLSLVRTGEK